MPDLQKIQADRIQADKDRLQLMLDSAPMGISYFSNDFIPIHCNLEIVKMFGLTGKDEYCRNFYAIMPANQPDGKPSKDAFQQILKDTFTHRKVQREFVFRPYGRDLVHTESSFVRVRHNGDNVVVGYTRDVTAKYKAFEREQKATETANLMLNAMPVACFLVLPDLTAIDCNNAALDLFGFSSKDEALERYLDIFPKYDAEGNPVEIGRNLDSVMEGRDSFSFEYNHQHTSGTHIACNVTLVRLIYHGQPVVASYLQDIRDIKHLYDQIRQGETAKEESRAKDQFLARMSHEIRTPVGVIRGLADIQLQKGGHGPEIEETFLQIQSSSGHLTSIINDILDLSKVAAGKMQIIYRPYETASLIMDTVQLNMMQRGSKDIKFILEIDEYLPVYFIGDELRIKQILNNLLTNAFKYTDQGHVILNFGVEYEGDQSLFIFSVEDTGQGMTPEEAASLFNAEYVRYNEGQNRYIQGVGLGMSITYNLVELMNGEITVETEPGKGTIFEVRIPQEIDGDLVLGKDTVKNLKSYDLGHLTLRRNGGFEYEPMPYGKVLVVDDQESNLYVARGLLLPYGLTIETVISGKEALNKIKNDELYDIIFMDHMMPDMDGLETARLIKEHGYTLPIVALTANTILGQAELFLNNGFAGFISKPIDLKHLDTYLLRLIRDKYPQEVIDEANRIKKESGTYPAPGVSDGILEAFRRDAIRAVEYLEAFQNVTWTLEELDSFTIITHGMKSSLANIGKNVISNQAAELEKAARSRDIVTIKDNLPPFIEDLKSLAIVLAKPEPSDSDSDSDPGYLLEQLQIIQWDCESYNKKGAKKALDELQKLAWSKGTRNLLNKLSVHLLHSEFEEAAAVVKAFI